MNKLSLADRTKLAAIGRPKPVDTSSLGMKALWWRTFLNASELLGHTVELSKSAKSYSLSYSTMKQIGETLGR